MLALFLMILLPMPEQQTSPLHGQRQVFAINDSVNIAMIWLEPGRFTMGSPQRERGRRADETAHSVTLTRGFWIGETEVTQAQWQALMGEDFWTHAPWHDRAYVREGKRFPAVYISWNQVQEYLARLRAAVNLPFRLPTEAEWEYACRANSSTIWHFGNNSKRLGDYAWFAGNTSKNDTAHEVAERKANAWGLYDMHGNVWEWCSDGYTEFTEDAVTDPFVGFTGAGRVIRGGSFSEEPTDCRAAVRKSFSPNHSFSGLGFRLAMESISPQ